MGAPTHFPTTSGPTLVARQLIRTRMAGLVFCDAVGSIGARASAQAAARPQGQPARRSVGVAHAQGASASAFMGGASGVSGAACGGRRRGSSSRGNLQVTNVIPMLQGDASQQLPPDLPSYLFKERIVYMVRTF